MVNAKNNIAYVKSLYDDHDYTVPRVHVTNATTVETSTPGIGGCVAVIGAFPDADTELLSFTTYRSMLRHYDIDEGTKDESTWEGLLACKYLFHYGTNQSGGCNEIIVCNITEEVGDTIDQALIVKDYDDEDEEDDESGVSPISYVETVNDIQTYGTEVEVTTEDNETITYDTKLTYRRLQKVLNRMYGEIFDLLFVADELQDAQTDITYECLTKSELQEYEDTGEISSGLSIYVGPNEMPYKQVDVEYPITTPFTIINDFLTSEFQMQRPSQLVCALVTSTPKASAVASESQGIYNISDRISEEDVEAVTKVFTEDVFSYGAMIMQQIYVDGDTTPLNMVNSAAYICGYIASLNVGTPLTFHDIPGVTGIDEVLEVGPNDTGYILTKYGTQVLVNKNRLSKNYCVLNSITPSGFDISQIRAVSYLIRQYELQEYLGLPNNTDTHNKIANAMNSANANVMSIVDIIQSVDTSNMMIPVDEYGNYYTHELYIEMRVIVNGVLMLIDLGVNMEESVG